MSKEKIEEILGMSSEETEQSDTPMTEQDIQQKINAIDDELLGNPQKSSVEVRAEVVETKIKETKEEQQEESSSDHGDDDNTSIWFRFDAAAKRYSKAIKEHAQVSAKEIIKELKSSHVDMSDELHDLNGFNERIQKCQSMRDRVSQIYLDIFPLAETVSQGIKTLMIYGQKFSSESSDKKREADIIDRMEQLGLSYMIDLNGELSMLCDTIQWTYKNLSGVHETLSRQITIWQERNRNDINRGAHPTVYNDRQESNGKSPLEDLKKSGKIGKHKQIEVDKSTKPGTVSWGSI